MSMVGEAFSQMGFLTPVCKDACWDVYSICSLGEHLCNQPYDSDMLSDIGHT